MSHFKQGRPHGLPSPFFGLIYFTSPQRWRLVPSVSVLALSSVLSLPGAALATDWTGTVSDDWSNPGNWDSGTPVAGMDVTIDKQLPSSTRLGLPGTTADWVQVGATAGHAGLLDILNGATLVNTTSYIGSGPNSIGTVNVDGMNTKWISTANLSIGEAGTGTLNILNGGLVSDNDGFVGHALGSTGTAFVGTDASWVHNGYFVVGGAGAGTVLISGGAVSNTGGIIGNIAGAIGAVEVDGGGSTWTNKAFLLIGESGRGMLAITKGGTVSNTFGIVGEQAGGNGTVAVDGNNSSWTNSADLFVGFDGAGALTVSNSATVSSVTGYIGSGATGSGTAKVHDQGSSWTTGGLVVGNFGSGGLDISNRGLVTSSIGILGNYAGSTGTAMIDSTASAWNNGVALYVGNQGTGKLAITGGGAVSNRLAIVGNQAGSTGVVTVDGVGSIWANSADLFVGNAGTGTLSILKGGKVTSVAGYVGHFGIGAATIDGQGSSWTNSDSLVVGNYGTGTLTMANGGKVSSSKGYVGGSAGGKGSVLVDGAGTAWTSGAYLLVGDAGTGTLAISKGGTVHSGVAILGNSGSGMVTVDGAGSAWLNATELYVGYGGIGTLTISRGGMVSGGTLVSVASLAGSAGTLNIGGAAGSSAVAPGTLNAADVQFGLGTGTIVFNHTDISGNYAFVPAISGLGTIVQSAGYTILTGDSSGFTGEVLVVGGRLAVNGSLANAPVSVSNGGILGDNGTVGNTSVSAGGIVAPGNSVGTLSINGNISFAAGSVYQVEVDPGQSDKIVASGTAVLNGTVQVTAGAGSYAPRTKYTILAAMGGVAGTFSGVTSSLVFLDPILSYDPSHVYLTLNRNNYSFASVGLTANQVAAGFGAESLASGNVIYDAVLQLSVNQARAAFEQISGEVHASVHSMMLQDSRFVRGAALDRLHSLDNRGAALIPAVEGKSKDLPSTRDLAYWGRAVGSWASLQGDGNAATIKRDTAGFLAGADRMVRDTWRVGLVGGYSHSSFDVSERTSSGTNDNYHLGAYAGSRWGDLALCSGLAYTWHDTTISRTIAFPGLADSLRVNYKAATTQAFAELGYRIKTEKAEFEPFANLAHVNVSSGGFAERGGTTALSSSGNSSGATFSTLGVRASTQVPLGGGTAMTARGSLGWRHAFGDTAQTTSLAFAGGSPFGIAGVSIAKSTAVVEVGLDFRLTPHATLGLSYGGQFGAGLKDQSARVNLNVSF